MAKAAAADAPASDAETNGNGKVKSDGTGETKNQEIDTSIYLYKGHLSAMRLICLYFFTFGTWVYSSLSWVRVGELLTPDPAWPRDMFEQARMSIILDAKTFSTPEPNLFIALVATVLGFLVSLFSLATFRRTKRMPDLRVRKSHCVLLIACAVVAARCYNQAQKALPFYFAGATTGTLLEASTFVALLNLFMFFDMNIMPVVYAMRMYTAHSFLEMGIRFHVSGKDLNFFRELLVVHPSPTPLAYHMYQLHGAWLRMWSFVLVLTTMCPGFVVYMLPDCVVRTVFVYMQVLTHIMFILMQNGPVPSLIQLFFLFACLVRDTPMTPLRITFMTLVYRTTILLGWLSAAIIACGQGAEENLSAMLLRFLPWEYYTSGKFLNDVHVRINLRSYDFPLMLLIGVTVVSVLTWLPLAIRLLHGIFMTPRARRSKTYLGAFGKFFAWWTLLGFVSLRQMRSESMAMDKDIDFTQFFFREPIVEAGTYFVDALFGDTLMYYPRSDLLVLMTGVNYADTSTIENAVHFDYLRAHRDDLWCTFEMKYAPPYNVDEPMKASWLYHPILEMKHGLAFSRKMGYIQTKQHAEHLIRGTPEFLEYFNYPESFFDEGHTILRQYQNRQFYSDYAEGFELKSGKLNVYNTGQVYRRQRTRYTYTKRFLLAQLYEYLHSPEYPVNVIKVVNDDGPMGEDERHLNTDWGIGMQIWSYSHGRMSDFEPVNNFMRRFPSQTVVDFAFASGASLALLFIIIASRRSGPLLPVDGDDSSKLKSE